MSQITARLFAIAALSVFIFGCGTISSHNLTEPKANKEEIDAKTRFFIELHYECDNPSEFIKYPYVYSGTKMDLINLTLPFHCGMDTGDVSLINNAMYILIYPFILVDLPISFVADTFMLKSTISKQLEEGNIVDPPYFKMGEMYHRKDDEKSIKYFEKGLSLIPKYFGNKPIEDIYFYLDLDDVFYSMADIYEKNGDYEKAAFYSEKHLELELLNKNAHPGIFEMYYKKLGTLYSKSNNNQKADYCFNKAAEYTKMSENR